MASSNLKERATAVREDVSVRTKNPCEKGMIRKRF
jgi:hypothetical protein